MMPTNTFTSGPIRLRAWLIYAAMLAGAIGLFFLINAWGMRLEMPGVAEPGRETGVAAPESPVSSGALVHVLVALTAVLVIGRWLAVFFRFVGPPPVIGEIVAGILLGPSLLGRVWPAAAAFVLPQSVAPNLEIIAQLGVILYMFLVGLELNPELLRERAHATVAISHASILAPFLLGSGLALFLYPRLSNGSVPFTSYALFLGWPCQSPLFRYWLESLPIVACRRPRSASSPWAAPPQTMSRPGACWHSSSESLREKSGGRFWFWGGRWRTSASCFSWSAPIARNFFMRFDERRLSTNLVALVFSLLLSSALITEYIGIHAVFGAFLAGAVIPHDSAIARALTQRLEDLVTVLLLPAFFAFTGMRTQIGLVSGYEQWLVCGLIILVATVGKFGGTLAAARLTGMGWRDSTALGLLMNTRGLMELIVLNIGLDMGVISPTLFAMMVVMALVTTMAAAPCLPRVTGA